MKNKIVLLTLLFAVLSMSVAEAQRGRGRGGSRGHSRGGSRGGHSRGGSSDSKFTVGASFGLAMPFGDLGNYKHRPDPADTATVDGAAKLGFHFNVNASYMFTENIGAVLFIGGNIHSFDAAKVTSADSIPTTVTLSGTSYYIGQYMIGPMFCFPISDALTFEGKLLGGLMTVGYPVTTTTGNGFFGTSAIGATSAFAYGAGVGVKFKLTDMFGIRGGVDYIGSSQNIKTMVSTSSFNPGSFSSSTNRTMSASLININLGVALSF